MRTVVKTHEVPHLWVHQTQHDARNPSHNLSFNGPVLFSYSTAIAEIFTNPRTGEKVAVIGDDTHSATTSKHVSEARRAARHLRTWRAPGTSRGSSDVTGANNHGRSYRNDSKERGAALFEYSIKQAAKSATLAERARKSYTKDAHNATTAQFLRQAQEVNSFFGLRRKVDAKAIDRLKDAEAREAKRREKAEAVRKERARLEERERLARWLAGEQVYSYFSASAVHLRIDPSDPNTVESTLGARVPRADVERAYRFITSKRGQQWRANGEQCPVGHYSIDAINRDGLIAGCHRITWDEIERFANVLGLTDNQNAVAAKAPAQEMPTP